VDAAGDEERSSVSQPGCQRGALFGGELSRICVCNHQCVKRLPAVCLVGQIGGAQLNDARAFGQRFRVVETGVGRRVFCE